MFMNVDTVIESAARDHKALLGIDATDKAGQTKAFESFKESIAALTRDMAQMAFQGERSKRKQWAELQKEIADLLDEGRGVMEAEERLMPEGNWEEKVDRRYQRMGSRIARLAGS
jgi:hypothetical protein